MEGTQVGALYKLSIIPVIQSTTESVSSISSTEPVSSTSPTTLITTSTYATDLLLWHNRMAHVNIQILKTMSKHNSLQDLPRIVDSHLP